MHILLDLGVTCTRYLSFRDKVVWLKIISVLSWETRWKQEHRKRDFRIYVYNVNRTSKQMKHFYSINVNCLPTQEPTLLNTVEGRPTRLLTIDSKPK